MMPAPLRAMLLASGMTAAAGGCATPVAEPPGVTAVGPLQTPELPKPELASPPIPPPPAAPSPLPLPPEKPVPEASPPADAPEPPARFESPAPPPSPSLDPAALLEAWRIRIQAEGPGRELDLARSHLLGGKPLKAHELLSAIDPKKLPSEEARLSWRLAEAEALGRLGEAGRASDLLREAERALRSQAPLQISGECFSADPKRRQKIETPRFRSGQTIGVYLDVDRLTVLTEEGKEARTKLRFDLTLLEPSGREVCDFADWEREQGVLEERMHRPWEDHAYRLNFRMPRGVNLGTYVLKVEVTDLAAPTPRKAAVTLPLTLE